MTYRASPFEKAALPDFLRFVSETAADNPPRPIYLMTSDVVWRLPGARPETNIRLWRDDAGLAGYVWFEPETGIEFDLRPDLDFGHPIASDLLGWAETRRRAFGPAYPRFVDLDSMAAWEEEVRHPRRAESKDGYYLTATAFESDSARIAFLARSGFQETKHYAPDYRCDLDAPMAENSLPPGMRLRHVTENDLAERVAAHRDAWPASQWDLARYREIRTSAVYDPELDIVLETGEGRFASYCIAWADPVVGMGSFEPLGTRPAWRGKGLGREVILEGFRRLARKGMRYARVGTAGFNAPARALYESCGFALVDRCRTFMKRLD